MSAKHTIGIVSKRTGLSPHLIRIWERRYGAVKPIRTDTNRRLYSEEDIKRLSLLHQATLAGESIGQIARLPLDELEEVVSLTGSNNIDISQRPNNKSLPTVNLATAKDFYEFCLKSVIELDPIALESTLMRASVELTKPVLLEQVIEPLMISIGEMWHAGQIKVLHEHEASAVIRTFLGNLASPINVNPGAPKIITATPPGQLHEFGALITTAVGSFDGWYSIYIGRNTPIDDIAAAANQADVKALALSIIYPADDPRLGPELIRLKDLLKPNLPIIVGGRGAEGYKSALKSIGAVTPSSIIELRSVLQKIRSNNILGVN